MSGWSAFAVVLAVGLVVFFDWVRTSPNRNIEGGSVRDRLVGDTIVPDVQHTLIHLAVLAAAVTCWVAFAGGA